MQNYESEEPRRNSEGKTSEFNTSKPIPSVPELSLVMDKPHHTQMQMNDSMPRALPELKLSTATANESSIRGSESYAAWKEKQFPRQMDKSKTSPNGFHRILSSTHNNSNLQNFHTPSYQQPLRSCSSENCNDYNCKSQSLSNNGSPKKYSDIQRARLVENIVNKYANNNGQNHKIDYHSHNDSQIRTPRAHIMDDRIISNERNYPTLSQTIDACDIGYRHQIHRSHSNPNVEAYAHRSVPIDYDYHSRSIQPMHFNHEPHHHSCTCCTPHHSNSVEAETVKHMLQIISSQNEQIKNQNDQMKNLNEQIKSQDEQIKNLQKQIERLIKLHEQSLKSRKQCTCQPPNGLMYQNAQMYAQNNYVKDNDRGYSEMNMRENEKSKQQAILEQKVSIGVMTSFELKVQNNQSVSKDKAEMQNTNNYDKILPSIPRTSNMLKNLVNDTGEMIRKKPTAFNPLALENISEGSESHLSSVRQSNLCTDTRQTPEAYDLSEVQNMYQEEQNESRQRHLENRHNMNGSRNRNDRWSSNDQQVSNPKHENVKRQIDRRDQGIKQYEYDLPYDNVNSRPYPNEKRLSPIESHRSSPYGENRSSPIGEHRTSPYHNKRNSPYEDDRGSAFEDNRLSPYRDERNSPYNVDTEVNRDDFEEEPLMTNLNKMKNPRRGEIPDECLSLSSSEVDVEEINPPSPERSIFLEMPEYSSESGSLPPQRQNKPGWTMCDNVLYQVNQILQNSSPANNDFEDDQSDDEHKRKNHYKGNPIINQVKAATFEQLATMGLSLYDNIDQRDSNYNQKVVCEESYYVRKELDTHVPSASIETDSSLVKAIDLKYLNKDQLKDIQKPRANMSVSQINYLHRYHLVPGNTEPAREAPKENYRNPAPHKNERQGQRVADRRGQNPKRYPQNYQGNSKVSYPSKILDVSALKQQPKLL